MTKKSRHAHMSKSIMLLVLVVMLLASPAQPQAQIPAKRPGVIRVLLTNLGLERRLDIGIYGSYLINGQLHFQRGSRLMLSANAGTILIHYEGLVYRAGDQLTMVRHAVDAGLENGLRFQDGLNLFEGDLVLSLKEQTLQAVLYIPVEAYLHGVVPYEMSDSFPLEALKAQAVAARTYALRNIKQGGDYDIVDNTNDQVFRGRNSNTPNASRAISETEGTVATFRGSLAHCFYTASNGGQTASAEQAWGREVVDYLPMISDPYDKENPESEVRTAVLPKKIKDGVLYSESFTLLVKQALADRLAEKGYDPRVESIRIDGVASASVHSPQHGTGSLLMTMLRLDLNLSVRQRLMFVEDCEVKFETMLPTLEVSAQTPAPTAEPWGVLAALDTPVSIDVPIFPTVECALNLSINQKANELVEVIEKDSAFIVTARRYGHGVGMSQRGAQWMAGTYGWKYEHILRFYYPGVELQKQMEIEPVQPDKLNDLFLATPGPIPTATPRPTLMPQSAVPVEGQWTVKVTGIGRNSSLNLRDEPSLSGKILQVLYYGQDLLVLARHPDGWLQVSTDVAQGYVMEQYVEPAGATP